MKLIIFSLLLSMAVIAKSQSRVFRPLKKHQSKSITVNAYIDSTINRHNKCLVYLSQKDKSVLRLVIPGSVENPAQNQLAILLPGSKISVTGVLVKNGLYNEIIINSLSQIQFDMIDSFLPRDFSN